METSNAPHYRWWQAPVASFYNKSFYLDVINNWQGAGVGYLFIICVLAAVIGTAPLALLCYRGYHDTTLPIFFKQVPQITFADGHVTIDKRCPYQIKDPNTGTIIAEFRTNQSGPPKLSDTGTNPPIIIITRDFMHLDSPSTNGAGGDARNLSFADLHKLWDRGSFNSTDVCNWWQTMMIWMPCAVLIFGIPLLFAGHLFQTLLYGLLAQFMFSCQEVPITYGTGMRLAAMAVTPCVVINSLLTLTALAVPMLAPLQGVVTLLSIPIALSVLFVAATALKRSTQAAAVAPAPGL